MKRGIMLMLFVAATFALASCGGGGGGGSGSTTVDGTGPASEPTTEAAPAAALSSLEFLTLDGALFVPGTNPVPKRFEVRATFDRALNADEQAAAEAAAQLLDGKGTAIAGAFEWNADGTQFVFSPSKSLGYKETGSFKVSDQQVPFTTVVRGDVNGDGVPDYMVGSPREPNALGPEAGAWYLYDGANPSHALNKIIGTTPGERLGSVVAIAGDINADGYADLMATSAPAGAPWTVHVYSGKDFQEIFSTTSAADNSYGFSVAEAGDVDSDGYDDILTSAPLFTEGGVIEQGRAWITGGADIISSPPPHSLARVLMMISGSSGDKMGVAVAGDADFNGNGIPDVLVGGAGKVQIVEFQNSAQPPILKELTGSGGSGTFGNSLAILGDITGDGLPDFAVGDFLERTVLIYDNAGTLIHTLIGMSDPSQWFGWKVAAVGDVNDDGAADLAVSDPYADSVDLGLTDSGQVVIYDGAALAAKNTKIIREIWGSENNMQLGSSLTATGDRGSAGKSLIIVGAPYRGKGFVYLYNPSDWDHPGILMGPDGGIQFGYALSGAAR